MSAVPTPGNFTCICGEKFNNALTLKHHRWITKHEPTNAPSYNPPAPADESGGFEQLEAGQDCEELHYPCLTPDPAQEAYLRALEVLRAKRRQQDLADRTESLARLVEFGEELICLGARSSVKLGEYSMARGRSAADSVINLMLVTLLMMGLVGMGMRLGHLVASSSGTGLASTPATFTVVAST